MDAPPTLLPGTTLGRLASRPFRVVALASAIVAMSGVDLYLTLLFLTQTGMSEANPLARFMIAYQSPAMLAAWKVLTVSLCVGILCRVRDRRCAELGAWTAAVVLALLMGHWTRYIRQAAAARPEFTLVAAELDSNWVRLDSPGVTP